MTAEVIWQQALQAKDERTAAMPTAEDALRSLNKAYVRLTELGWRDSVYCPKDGTVFEVIEAGSLGIHDCSYVGDWPKGDGLSMRVVIFGLRIRFYSSLRRNHDHHR